jgi:hypothetical protein
MPKPEKIIMVGPCRASVFRNTFVKDGKQIEMPKVVFELRFKDKKSGQWKGTSTLNINEIPKAVLALQKAYDYLLSKKE